jgi:hypothetical protein
MHEFCVKENTIFHEMKQLCHKKGYTSRRLFKRFNPKPCQPFTGTSHQDDTSLTKGKMSTASKNKTMQRYDIKRILPDD